MKVKLFETDSAENLETQINDWLDNNKGIHIESIGYTSIVIPGDYYGEVKYSAVILYNEN